MSYVCMMANENGIVAAGDSRESSADGTHFDLRHKVFVSSDGTLIWSCCGLSRAGGTDYVAKVNKIMNIQGADIDKKLGKIAAMMTSATASDSDKPEDNSHLNFCIMIGQSTGGNRRVYMLNASLGKHAVKEFSLPVSIHSGYMVAQLPSLDPAAIKGLDTETLRQIARKRVELAITEDEIRTLVNPSHRQSIGGKIFIDSIC